ncbi:hypothetical protein N7449_000026 [Penicillium cf. viridicatum]|uniref:Uncharacterized protein n=1 Tax=Penicillium cf. viridicatum TaxID=2972119 RepID=A0A9W9N4Y6_9EURO|nr:hypothetical protein N7449_012567 [Penicillium cf. viridicatum]KAJ5181029.1 hypothetical protein N7449_012580 [Penicillium cf. viridicatum]KAJ5181042.1 hypothetical protein N7449_012593 [Penicillium cf. viridicatum]KAJ5212844.1 hypothetical protein N7449_000013 [Penicillium cf. viridicatum]KAJ5212857.1 hypothetical protein N7449_000026 [Penicillium cf. viridicatum]
MVAALRRTSALGGITHRSGVTRDPATLDPPPVSSSPRSVTLVVTPGLVATGARGPFGPRHRWGLWIDGRWPYPKLRFLEGAAPWDPPFAGVVHGVWTLHPRATCRSLPAPSRAPGRINCVRTGAEEFSGGNWMVSASPRYAGGAAATGRLVRPFHLTTFYPLGGLGSRDSPAARWVGPRDVLP